MRVIRFLVVILFLIPFFVNAEVSRSERAAEAQNFTVRIVSQRTNFFEPTKRAGGHGSGIIAEIGETEGYVFTNHHVVASTHLDARIVVLQFHGAEGVPEQVIGEVVHESEFYDFAVVKFDPRQLKRNRKTIRAAKFPTFQEFLKYSEVGRMGMTYGSPLDAVTNATFGSITSKSYGRDWGISKEPIFGPEDFIRTEAAINGGNSGGPLIDLESGMVIGINSAKYAAADVDNVGLTIPIIPLIEEWSLARRSPAEFSRKTVEFAFSQFSKTALDLDGSSSLIEQRIPRFFDFYDGALAASMRSGSVAGENIFETGDIVLSVNDEVVGNNEQKLFWVLNRAEGNKIEFKVLRRGKEIAISMPVKDLRAIQSEMNNEFLLVGGLFLQNLPSGETSGSAKGVRVMQVLSGSPAQQISGIMTGSIITHIDVGEERLPVNSVAELHEILKKFPDGSVTRVVARVPVLMGEHGAIMMEGEQLLATREFSLLLPVVELLGPKDLELERIRKGFDFTHRNPASLNWRNYIKTAPANPLAGLDAGCGVSVAGLTGKT